MLISYNWLRELTDTILSPAELREALTNVGLAIDAVEDQGGDQILDVEVPSNRPDCLSHIGIAREVAVIESGQVIFPPASSPNTAGHAADFTSVEIKDPDLCPRYAARIIRGVRIGPSPDWLVQRLQAIGQRPINNVADITNYVLHEMGQPLHAFDLAKLADLRIVVRRAYPGELLTTLDGVERKLSEEMLVIADAKRAVALAGVMGGEDSEISSRTTDVLIESAYFNPDSIRRTARALGMDTEASRRFERGADREGVLLAQQRCIDLICEIAGGVATEDAIDCRVDERQERIIELHFARIEALTSLRVAVSTMLRILNGLGFCLNEHTDDKVNATVPSWRIDVELEEDLVEEVARHTGYQAIGYALPPSHSAGEYQPDELKRRALRRSFTAAGYDEAINFSFIDTNVDRQVDPIPEFVNAHEAEPFITLRNPIIENVTRMRQTLLPGLLDSLRHNLNHGQRDVSLFEIGRIFSSQGPGELPNEVDALAMLSTGGAVEEGQARVTREIDFYDLKGALEAAIAGAKLGPIEFEAAAIKHLREGQTAIMKIDGKAIGSLGRLAEATASAYKFRQPVYLAELNLSALLASPEAQIQYQPLARYPSVVRDVTLLINRDTNFNDLKRAVADEDMHECRSVRLVGVYEGGGIPADRRSISLRLEYRSDERTLRDDEVEGMHLRIVAALEKKFNAVLH